MRVAQQPIHRIELTAKQRVIPIRSNRRQSWTQPALQRNLRAVVLSSLLHTRL